MTSNRGALSDLRVLELGEFVSAPWCGKLLSGMGAEVIKVEPPATGDKARRAGPFPGDVPHPEKSGLFLYLNTDKLGITLDVTQATGRRLFLDLVSKVDLVIDNHLPHELRAWGLDYEHLREANPRVILTSITPFGWEGPWSSYKGDDLVAFQTSGTGHGTPVGSVTDPDSQPPLKGAEYQADMGAGWTAASAAMVAIRNQWRFDGDSFTHMLCLYKCAEVVCALDIGTFSVLPNLTDSGTYTIKLHITTKGTADASNPDKLTVLSADETNEQKTVQVGFEGKILVINNIPMQPLPNQPTE